jgi:hypothetical protein
VAGLLVVGACTIAGTAAAADGAGPVATPPSTPQTQTVSGVAANGVQLAVTAPAQLPLDPSSQPLPEREVDVTVKDVGGQGYSGQVSMTLAPEGGGASAASLRVDHFDLASGAWKSVPSGDSSFTVADSVTVPASGTQVLKLRLSPGTSAVSDVKLNVAANGATAVATMPVTGLSFQVSGLSGSGRAGSPMLLTGTLSNPTDVGLQNVPVKLLLCSGGAGGSDGSAGSTGCLAHASDVKVEVQGSSGAWHPVTVSGATASSPMSATVVPQLTLPAGGSAQFSVRVTVGAGAFGTPGQPSGQPSTPAAAQPMSVAVALSPVGLSFDGQPTMSGTLTVQPPLPQASSTPATPSSTGTSATADPTPTDSSTAADDPTATPTGTLTSGAAPSTEGASMPAASASSSNPTILVAAGLLAVCLALVLWWVLMKRRERMARVAVAHAGDDEDLHDDQQ